MPAEFVTLAELLRPRIAIDAPIVETNRPDEPVHVQAIVDDRAAAYCSCEGERKDESIRAARHFRAALADALAHATASLIRELASDVLARELAIAPCEIDALVARLASDHVSAGPLRVRVSPLDRLTACEFPIVVDASIQAGDAILECTSGTVDARLGVRLCDVLDRAVETL